MTNPSGRFLGGHYDSLKQYIVFMNLPSLDQNLHEMMIREYYNRYKIRLMIDLIFCNTLILPYSQYLDGLFFHLLFSNTYGDGFLTMLQQREKNSAFSKRSPILEVRYNPEYGSLWETVNKGILANPAYIYSSLEGYSKDISKQLFHVVTQYFPDKQQIDLSDPGFKKALRNHFGNSNEAVLLEQWLDHIEVMSRSVSFAKPWTRDFNESMKTAKQQYINDYYFFDAFLKDKRKNIKGTYQGHIDEQEIRKIEQLYDSIDQHFAPNLIIPDRSDIKTRLMDCSLSETDKSEILSLYNYFLNYVFKIQHECDMIDEGPFYSYDPESDYQIEEILSNPIKNGLATMKWDDYALLHEKISALKAELMWDDANYYNSIRTVARQFITLAPKEYPSLKATKLTRTLLTQATSAVLSILLTWHYQGTVNLLDISGMELGPRLLSQGIHVPDIRDIMKQSRDIVKITDYASNCIVGGGSNQSRLQASDITLRYLFPDLRAQRGGAPKLMLACDAQLSEDTHYASITKDEVT